MNKILLIGIFFMFLLFVNGCIHEEQTSTLVEEPIVAKLECVEDWDCNTYGGEYRRWEGICHKNKCRNTMPDCYHILKEDYGITDSDNIRYLDCYPSGIDCTCTYEIRVKEFKRETVETMNSFFYNVTQEEEWVYQEKKFKIKEEYLERVYG